MKLGRYATPHFNVDSFKGHLVLKEPATVASWAFDSQVRSMPTTVIRATLLLKDYFLVCTILMFTCSLAAFAKGGHKVLDNHYMMIFIQNLIPPIRIQLNIEYYMKPSVKSFGFLRSFGTFNFETSCVLDVLVESHVLWVWRHVAFEPASAKTSLSGSEVLKHAGMWGSICTYIYIYTHMNTHIHISIYLYMNTNK